MRPTTEPTDDELGEYVDGGLSEKRRAEIAAWLLAHPHKAAEVERLQRLNEALKDLGTEILEEPVPDRLRRVLRRPEVDRESGGANGETGPSADDQRSGRAKSRGARSNLSAGERPSAQSWPRLVEAAAILVVFVLGGVLGWTLRPYLDRGRSEIDEILADASYAHSVYAADRNYPIEFPRGQEDVFAAIATRSFERVIVPPDLESVGYRYLGARLVPTARITSTLFLFEDQDGRRVTVLFWPFRPTSAVGSGSLDVEGVVARFWLLGGFGFAVLGEEANRQLSEISGAVEAFYRDALAGSTG